MIENIPEALRWDGAYTSRYDDCTNRYAKFVTIDGIPGTWPEGRHIAARASQVRGMADHVRIAGATLPEDEQVAMVVDYGDMMGRITDPDVAHLGALYEDHLRGYLPSAREALIAAHAALAAYQDEHSVPEEPTYAPGHLPMAQEVWDDRRAIQERFAKAVGPEVFAEGVELSRVYRAAQQRLGGICMDLQMRGATAEWDFLRGEDRTLELRAADAAKYGPVEP